MKKEGIPINLSSKIQNPKSKISGDQNSKSDYFSAYES
jgi:hypothetical protein